MCLSCHFGDETKFVDHRMMGAGHPRLSFELDTFTQIEPAHFVVDDDYRARKHVAGAVQTWAIGQGMALSQTLEAVLDPKRNRDGIFPEPVLFDCHACHQPMSAGTWQAAPEPGSGAGHRPLQRRQPGHAADRGGRRLAAAGQAAGRPGPRLPSREPQGRAAVAGGGPRPAADGAPVRPTCSPSTISTTSVRLRALLDALVREGTKGEYVDYMVAEQTTMAMGTLVQAMHDAGVIADAEAARVEAVMDEMYQAVAEDERYRPKVALDALKRVQSAAR